MKINIILIIVIALLVGSLVGYGFGFTKGSFTSMELGLRFAKNFMDIEFNEEEIAAGIFAYENRINDCFTVRELNNGNKESRLGNHT